MKFSDTLLAYAITETKTIIFIGLAFLFGTMFGSVVAVRSYANAAKTISLEEVAEKTVKNVAAAYEDQINKSGIFERFEKKFTDCMKENASLKLKSRKGREWRDLRDDMYEQCKDGNCQMGPAKGFEVKI